MTGKGSVNHNSRKFHAKNTDPERSCLNVEYCKERNNLYEKQNDLKGQKYKIEKSLER